MACSVRPGSGRSRPGSPKELLLAEAGPGSSKLQVTQWWRWWRWRREPVLPTSVFPQHSWFLSGSAWQKQTQWGEERVNHRGLHGVEGTERKHGSQGTSLTASPSTCGSARLLLKARGQAGRRAGAPTPRYHLGLCLSRNCWSTWLPYGPIWSCRLPVSCPLSSSALPRHWRASSEPQLHDPSWWTIPLRGLKRWRGATSSPHTVEQCRKVPPGGQGGSCSVRVPVLEQLRAVREEGAVCAQGTGLPRAGCYRKAFLLGELDSRNSLVTPW